MTARRGCVVTATSVALAAGLAGCTTMADHSADPPPADGPSAVAPTAPAPIEDRDAATVSPGASAGPADVWADEPPLGPVPDFAVRPATSREAVVGYLRAAHTVEATDASIRHRRHHPWLHPAAPGRTGGYWIPDPPPAGVTRRVEIVELARVASSEAGAAWEVVYQLWDAAALQAERIRYVATRQVDDGTWSVMAETDELQPVAH